MSSIIKPIGSIFQGEANAAAARYNAQVSQQNAVIARQQGQAAMQAQQRSSARAIGQALALYGASGVATDSGSPLDVLADSARMAELNRLTIQYNSELKSYGFETQSTLDYFKERTSRTAGYLNAAADVAESMEKAAGKGGGGGGSTSSSFSNWSYE